MKQLAFAGMQLFKYSLLHLPTVIVHALLILCLYVTPTGRVDPVPLQRKDDSMGLGRFAMEVSDQ